MGGDCQDLFDLVPETLVLAFDVTGWTTPRDATRVARAKAVVDAINKELQRQGSALSAKHFGGQAVTQADALKALAALGGKFADDRSRALQRRLACAYKESPLGVWLDRHEWVLYVFVPLIVGGAGTWMYVARVGDTPAGWVAPMANVKKDWKIQHLGRLELGTSDVKFVPSQREISGKVFAMLDWERLAVKLTIGAGSANDRFAQGTVQTDLTLPQLKFAGSGAATNLSLTFGTALAFDPAGLATAALSAGAGLKTRLGPVPLSLDLAGGLKFDTRTPVLPPPEFNVMLKLGLEF